MNKVIQYECKRLLWNKIFFGILIICLFLSFSLLHGEILMGVSNTAPFSPWSFGSYLSQLIPIICLGELFFLTFFISDKKRNIDILIKSTPISPRRYAVMRCGTIFVAALLLVICVIALYLGFFSTLFGTLNYGELMLPALLAVLPTMLFCLGAGYQLGAIHPILLYLLMPAVFILSSTPLLDLSMGNYFHNYPLVLGNLDPAFTVNGTLLCKRALYGIIGILLLVIPCLDNSRWRYRIFKKYT